jgi:hypothetical protein
MRNISADRRMVLLSSMTITRTPVRFLESATLASTVNGRVPGQRCIPPKLAYGENTGPVTDGIPLNANPQPRSN